MCDKEQELERDEIGIAIEEMRVMEFYSYEKENYLDSEMVEPLITHKHNLRLVTEDWTALGLAEASPRLATSSEATIKGGDGGEAYLMSTTDNRLVLAEAKDIFPVQELEGMVWNPTFRAVIDMTLRWLEGGDEVAELYDLALRLEDNLKDEFRYSLP
jgi:hypothetical protein